VGRLHACSTLRGHAGAHGGDGRAEVMAELGGVSAERRLAAGSARANRAEFAESARHRARGGGARMALRNTRVPAVCVDVVWRATHRSSYRIWSALLQSVTADPPLAWCGVALAWGGGGVCLRGSKRCR